MRRSKSNPAKYARNYRKISQRKMTAYDDDAIDEEKELNRLQNVLKHSEDHLRKARQQGQLLDDEDSGEEVVNNKATEEHDDDDDEEAAFERARQRLRNSTEHLEQKQTEQDLANAVLKKSAKKKGTKRARNSDEQVEEDKEQLDKQVEVDKEESSGDKATAMISEELLSEHQGDDADLVILPSKKKKQKKKGAQVLLTPEEIKEAKKLKKKTERKLQQLSKRAEQKKKRSEIYDKLQETAIDKEEMELLLSSSTVGMRISKKEQLKRLIQKERAGIELTKEEKDLLYRDRNTEQGGEDGDDSGDDEMDVDVDVDVDVKNETSKPNTDNSSSKKKTTEAPNEKQDEGEEEESENKEAASKKSKAKRRRRSKDNDSSSTTRNKKSDKNAPNHTSDDNKAAKTTSGASSFAAQMMASLTKLKVVSELQKEELEKEEQEETERRRQEEERKLEEAKGAPYKVTNPVKIQTAATNKNLPVHQLPTGRRHVLTISRPQAVQKARYELPVAQMEYEVMDAIRNNDVTIVCGETGSGKSTQMPQLLYESGFTLESPGQRNGNQQEPKHKFQIGITQPRRVAAVSTAKRVCYEMGQGDGQIIRSSKRKDGNTVAYQTRYETAGLGKDTCVKFMTDGILLQEIQSDLLLRKYSVIVLDEVRILFVGSYRCSFYVGIYFTLAVHAHHFPFFFASTSAMNAT